MQKQTKIILTTGGVLGALALLFKPVKKQIVKALNDQEKREFLTRVLPAVKAVGNKIGVPPLFILAQIALESRYGNSTLSAKYFNYGGIKAVPGQPYVELPTIEYIKGQKMKIPQKFARFNNEAEGIAAQGKILTNKYFKKYANKTSDPMRYAQLLQSGSPKYATAPQYPEKIAGVLKEINRLLT